eukprot:CAMPEP_0198138002 /NCGR_PEP_ID=MMETSP1443-20131203/1439_1 /TAXON_ID=186043 /ORGANISM="Entomoneis sp., Strain CCMP2396" /LENGTH=254 /DNA_ID=CAMNT_0043799617 /DNA_START=114 /DNA_END=878 /DNA_ORIENTATION=-
MSNVHGLFSGKNDDDTDDDDENNRYVGGVGDRGGGSGLAVRPNNDEGDDNDRDRLFGMAESAGAEDDGQVRRTITMYRDGFVVDDGPYRRLDDPANAEFLRALAMGRTPRELEEEGGAGQGNVLVGLVDKRQQEYVETFRTFSGQGTTLGGSAASATNSSTDGTFNPSTLTAPAAVDDAQPTTSVAVRLLNGKRQIVKINLSSTVQDLASHLREAAGDQSFRLSAGFPPQPLMDASATVEAAGLKGAQVSMLQK